MKDLYLKLSKNKKMVNERSIKWNIDKSIRSMAYLSHDEEINKFFNHSNLLTTKNLVSRTLEKFYEKY